ncbi:MAG: rubrerythrin family protein [Lachnospiraceae bacterium]|nr:rubrerythrin family protein [Lachnospiraceae bacterium]
MEEKRNLSVDDCSFAGVRPIMVDLPYPPIKVQGTNPAHASLLSIDYCGAVSEMSAIAQYINNENRLASVKCPVAKTLLGIAMAEMMHLQKLGELIVLLGGTLDFTAPYRSGNRKLWTPEYLTIPEQARQMLQADMDAERAAIDQYRMHINRIADNCVNAVLERIIEDEEYHIMVLRLLMKTM